LTATQRRGRRASFDIGDVTVGPGRRAKLELPIARLVSGTPVALPVILVHGAGDGPTMWLSAAIHGDELCGVEIIRRVLGQIIPKSLRGTIIAVPIVNVHGFNTGDRYLPDRRDLNRSFPGSARGSLASRIADLIMTEIIERSSHGIDLHTGSDHRTNLPQVRGDLDNPDVLAFARTFAAPLSLHAKTRDGSLRAAATEAGATVLLFEGGEADRFDETAIQAGTDGVLRCMAAIDMIDHAPDPPRSTRFSRRSRWMRASRSGIMHLDTALGDQVERGQRLATIHDPYGTRLGSVTARSSGIIIGHSQRPLVNRGDAVVHIAEIEAG
jgi:predicted deacylase